MTNSLGDTRTMGKSIAYVATAILLGIVAMLPVVLLTPESADQGYYPVFQSDMHLDSKADVESLRNLYGLRTPAIPSSPLHTGVIVTFSFVSAFSVYFYFKRKYSRVLKA
jgi:hypothetical protein